MGHEHPLLHLINEFEAQIRKFDLGSLAMDIILESRRKLYTIISQFNYTLNVEAPINKLVPDILYKISTFVVDHETIAHRYLSPLVISHVCQHWRKSALEWPTLWRFINPKGSLKLIEMFLYRSKDTPLELYIGSLTRETGQKLDLQSCANRLRLLTLDISPYQLRNAQHLFRHPGLQLQLQHLKIAMEDRYELTVMRLLTEFMELDLSCLQSLCFEKCGLPLVKLPPNNTLTQFVFRSEYSPVLSQLLVFLSTCPLLRELQLSLAFISEPEFATPTCPLTINRLDFPQLQRLVLQLRNGSYKLGTPCLNYMKKLSARIGTMGQLSYFSLYYYEFYWRDGTLPVSSIFELVPSETFHHFSDQVCSALYIDQYCRHLRLSSAPECLNPSTHSLTLYGSGTCGSEQRIDRSVFELIYALPRITHLVTYCETFKFLNDHDIFQCLNTLGLIDPFWMTEVMDIFPPNLKKLVLYYYLRSKESPQNLLDAILGTGIEVLELIGVGNESELEEAISIIRQTGVVVLITWSSMETSSTRFDWNKLE